MSARGLFRATGTAAGSEAAGFGPEKKSFHATTPQIPSATTSNRYVSGRDFMARKEFRDLKSVFSPIAYRSGVPMSDRQAATRRRSPSAIVFRPARTRYLK